MKLQILVPQYQETDTIVKTLLDSIAIQQNVDFTELGVIICNDGTDTHLSEALLNSYPFKIEYYLEPHTGVSGTRNACLSHATADYVMFCDADDMFFNACGLYIIMREIDSEPFDSLVSAFVEESRHPDTKEAVYVNHDMDSTFVHGKVHRRKYLIDHNIRWNPSLVIHEDSYFNILCQRLSTNVKYCSTAFYLWKWRDNSVCRHDPKYILKTYNNMLDSSTALVEQFLQRQRIQDAQFYSVSMIYDAYYTMNKSEWVAQGNQQYRHDTELRFKQFFQQFEMLFQSCPDDLRSQIIIGIKNRMFEEGLLLESQTFDQWITHIRNM